MPDIDIDYSRACLLGECGPYPNPNMTYADTLNTYSGSGNVGSSSGKFPASGDGGCPPMAKPCGTGDETCVISEFD